MNQCARCKYVRKASSGWTCKKRTIQLCVREAGVQKLLLTNLCSLLNPNDDCPEFQPKRSHPIRPTL